jgi:hypothetical protein
MVSGLVVKAAKRHSPGVGNDDCALWDEIAIVPIVLRDIMMSVVKYAGLLNKHCTYTVRALQ